MMSGTGSFTDAEIRAAIAKLGATRVRSSTARWRLSDARAAAYRPRKGMPARSEAPTRVNVGTIQQELVLPWPSHNLSPNVRLHWDIKRKAVKRARRHAWCVAYKAGWHHLVLPAEGKLHLWLDFYPPGRHRQDDDNLVASMKSARDGIADALGIDDNRFKAHHDLKDEVRKGGEVRIRITLAGTDEPAATTSTGVH